jgi:pectate lyase
MFEQNAYEHSEATQGQGASGGAGAFDGGGRISGAGQGRNRTVRIVEWETLTGKVIVVDGEITIQTAEGQVLVGMGQSAYREGFALEVGDEITVLGFHEDGEFKAGTVENLTTGETIVLRDETGRHPELVEG